ncbi:MAG: sigma-70 family RNA polymerase sigma factor [Nevskia sp.]|nr:sigma-70 family RNA polymerase sigma factor [Nevskia sp.]
MTLPNNGELESWMSAIAAGQRWAFDRLYTALLPRVLAFSQRLLSDELAADDCAAETFVRVWRDAAKYDVERGCVLAWVFTICRTRALDLLRARRRQNNLSEAFGREFADSVPDGADELIAAFDARLLVHPLLLRLSAEQQRLVGLAFFDGLTHSEIAAATGLPLGTVKSHIHRALATMRQGLGKGPPDLLRQGKEEVING